MRIHLENFLCYTDHTFDLGDDGLTLISGPSGAGKTSILRGIFFALFGEGSKLQSYGKTSAKVELEFGDIKIIRTKRPNRLIVNDIYEDQSGQEIINKYFGDTFKTSGYIQQNNLTSFILKSPRDKLEMLEMFIGKDICIGDMKKRLHIEMGRRRDEVTSTSSNLRIITKLLENTTEPEVVEFPIRCSKKSRAKAIKNTTVRHKNCTILISRAEKKIQRVRDELVATKVLNAELKGLKIQLNTLRERDIKLTEKLDDLGYSGDHNLKKYTMMLTAVNARQKLYDLRTRYAERQRELEQMEIKEREAKEQELESLKKDLYTLYTKEDLNDIIVDTKTSIDDFSRIIHLEQSISRLDNNFQQLDCNRQMVDEIQQELEKSQEIYDKLESTRDSYICPSCSKTLQLCDGKLILCSDTSVADIDPKELENAANTIKDLHQKLNKLRQTIMKQEHDLKLFNEYTSEKQDLLDKYEQCNSVEEYLDTLRDDLEYLREYKASQKALSKKISKLEAQDVMSEAYYISEKKVRDLEEMLAIMEIESKPGEDLEIEDRERLIGLIDQEKEHRSSYNSITATQKDVKVHSEKCELQIDAITKKHKLKFKKVRSSELMEKCLKKYTNELTSLRQQLKDHTTMLEDIRLWESYEDKRKAYSEMQQRVEDLKNQETEARQRYGAVMTLKEKMLQAESLAMLHIIEIINTHARAFLDIFFPDNPISVQLKPFKTTKKSVKPAINVEIEYKGMECDLLMLSGGELSRVVLAYTLALAEMFNTPLLLLDECTASLDQDMTGIVFEGIRENFNGKLTLIIAHQVISGTFDKIVSL